MTQETSDSATRQSGMPPVFWINTFEYVNIEASNSFCMNAQEIQRIAIGNASSIGKYRNSEVDEVSEAAIRILRQCYGQNAGRGADNAHVIDTFF